MKIQVGLLIRMKGKNITHILDIPIPSKKDQKIQAGSHIAVGYLDAKNVDVMQGTNAVIFTLDQRKDWTWTYVQNEIVKIPNTLPVLILVRQNLYFVVTWI